MAQKLLEENPSRMIGAASNGPAIRARKRRKASIFYLLMPDTKHDPGSLRTAMQVMQINQLDVLTAPAATFRDDSLGAIDWFFSHHGDVNSKCIWEAKSWSSVLYRTVNIDFPIRISQNWWSCGR